MQSYSLYRTPVLHSELPTVKCSTHVEIQIKTDMTDTGKKSAFQLCALKCQ